MITTALRNNGTAGKSHDGINRRVEPPEVDLQPQQIPVTDKPAPAELDPKFFDSVVPNAKSRPKIWELRGRGITDAESALACKAANDSMRRQSAAEEQQRLANEPDQERSPRQLTRAEQFPRGFQLSDLYSYLTDSQRTVLVVARSIVSGFSRSRAVDIQVLQRICHRYHGVTKSQIRRAIKRLRERGIVGLTPSGSIQLLPSAADWLVKQQQDELGRMQQTAAGLSPSLQLVAQSTGQTVAELLQSLDSVRPLLV